MYILQIEIKIEIHGVGCKLCGRGVQFTVLCTIFLKISFILGSNPCDGTDVRQWVQDVRISSFLNHIHNRLKEKRVEKSLFFHQHCIQRHFIMIFETIFGSKNLLHPGLESLLLN